MKYVKCVEPNLSWHTISMTFASFDKECFRRVQDIGLQENDLMDPLFRGNICMIPALRFVPVRNVILAFHELCKHCGIDEQPVSEYFETNDIG